MGHGAPLGLAGRAGRRLFCRGPGPAPRPAAVLALPTETFYALAVNPFDAAALARLFGLKGRPAAKSGPGADRRAGDAYPRWSGQVPAAAFRWLAPLWPGPLTLILPARPDLPPLLTGGTGTIGVRQPRQHLVCRLLAALGLPVPAPAPTVPDNSR